MSIREFVRSAAVALVLAAAGCGSSGVAGTPGSPLPQPSVLPVPETAGGSPPAATTRPLDRPTAATLGGLSTGAADGNEGSFSWGALVSDTPWIVGPDAGTALPGARLEVGFRPALLATTWQAHWAPVAGDAAGDPVDGGSGGGGPVLVRAPGTAGSWSLQLTAEFGASRTATWYWRLRVAP